MTRPTVVLFDIDGTLVTCGGAGRASMERAFDEVLGRRDAGGFDFGGMTDRAIARAAARAAGKDDDDSTLDRVLDRYLSFLAEELPRSSRYAVLPGVIALLDALAAHTHVAIGLGTGNLETGARLKLTHGGLWDRFAFGGYGSDAEDRGALLAEGARRGAERLGLPVARVRVVVIGDTPRDVRAGRAIGASVIAVATGGSPLPVLASHGPELAVSTLADPRVLPRVL